MMTVTEFLEAERVKGIADELTGSRRPVSTEKSTAAVSPSLGDRISSGFTGLKDRLVAQPKRAQSQTSVGRNATATPVSSGKNSLVTRKHDNPHLAFEDRHLPVDFYNETDTPADPPIPQARPKPPQPQPTAMPAATNVETKPKDVEAAPKAKQRTRRKTIHLTRNRPIKDNGLQKQPEPSQQSPSQPSEQRRKTAHPATVSSRKVNRNKPRVQFDDPMSETGITVLKVIAVIILGFITLQLTVS